MGASAPGRPGGVSFLHRFLAFQEGGPRRRALPWWAAAAGLALALLLGACGGSDGGDSGAGESTPPAFTSVYVYWEPGTDGAALTRAAVVSAKPEDVNSVVVTVTDDQGDEVTGSPLALTYNVSVGRWEGELASVPTGQSLTFTGRAYASTDGTGTVLFEGTATTTLTGSGDQVVLRLDVVGTIEVVLPVILDVDITDDQGQPVDWVELGTTATFTVTLGGDASETLHWTIAVVDDQGSPDPAGGTFAPASSTDTGAGGAPVTTATTNPVLIGSDNVYTGTFASTYTPPGTVGDYRIRVTATNSRNDVVATTQIVAVRTGDGAIATPLPEEGAEGVFTFVAPVVTSISAERTASNDLALSAAVATEVNRTSLFYNWGYTPDAGTPGDLAFLDTLANPATLRHYTPPASGSIAFRVDDGAMFTDVTFALRAGQFPDVAPAGPWRPVLLSLSSSNHACARLSWGDVSCWGSNSDGQLGDGTQTDSTVPLLVAGLPAGSGAVTVATGESHTCAALVDTTVWCWGSNDAGQLGTGATSTRSLAPVQVCAVYDAGTSTCTSYLTGAKAVGAGRKFTCALMGDGSVRCWGIREFGKLGDDGATSGFSALPVAVSLIGSPNKALSLSVGEHHACVLLDVGGVWCWGRNASGQLGNEDANKTDSNAPVAASVSNAVAVSAGMGGTTGGFTCARINDGTAQCWGDNGSGRLGDGTTNDSLTPVQVCAVYDSGSSTCTTPLTGVAQVAAGDTHACAVLDTGGVRCWGNDTTGQLGNGTDGSSTTPVAVYGIDNATRVAAGNVFTCALLATGAVRCWGNNSQGALGFGQPSASTTPGNTYEYPVAVDLLPR